MRAMSKLFQVFLFVGTMSSISARAFGPPSEAERAQRDAALQTACGSDFQSLCPSASDPHAKFECLRSNEANLSTSCAAFVAEMKSHRPPGPPPRSGSEGTESTSSSKSMAGSQ